MARVQLPENIIRDLSKYLGGEAPAQSVSRATLSKRGFLPSKFEWNPDLCLIHEQHAYLLHAVASPEIPDWVARPVLHLRGKFRKSKLVVLVRRPDTGPVWKVAGTLTKECIQLKGGLAVETSDGACLVFPPDLVPPKPHKSDLEAGHIPSWVVDRLIACEGFSSYLERCFDRFSDKYRRAITGSPPSYDEESEILVEFARDVKHGDPRLFVPLGLLNTLGEMERLREQGISRDHFFHTFNNLFLGFLILGELFANRGSSKAPDRYIRDTAKRSRILPWEALWFLTCLFHDPGYIAEKIWMTVSYAYGFPSQLTSDEQPPEQIREQLNNAWDVYHKEVGEEIISLFQRLKNEKAWLPPRFDKVEASSFNSALRRSYFDGIQVGHSLQSGLHLINYCLSDKAARRKEYDHKVALTACEIAALSMMFHDQHCRDMMRQSDVKPLAFEHLPYAAVLMYVDALQDDRRDITKNRFPKHGVLEDVEIYTEGSRKLVRARVCLRELPLTWWPGKIEEYENVMRWINAASDTSFTIDYQSRAWQR